MRCLVCGDYRTPTPVNGPALRRRNAVPGHGSSRERPTVPVDSQDCQPGTAPHRAAREIGFAYFVLITFLLIGKYLLRFLSLEQQAVSIAGGIVLFLISLRMIFPGKGGLDGPSLEGEPFVVPLAIPLLAGPSTLATVLLLHQRSGLYRAFDSRTYNCMGCEWRDPAVIHFFLSSVEGAWLIAMERLMGMLLVMVAVQMLLNGLRVFLQQR